MEFELEKLVYPVVPSEYLGKRVINLKCNLCHTGFQSDVMNTIKRHYTTFHHYQFSQIRKKSWKTRNGTTQKERKPKHKTKLLENPFPDLESYRKWCINLHTRNKLSFTFWDSPEMRTLTKLFEKSFNTVVDGHQMREWIASQREAQNEEKERMVLLEQWLAQQSKPNLEMEVPAEKVIETEAAN